MTMDIPIKYTALSCAERRCGVVFFIEDSMVERLRMNHESFFCPNGHSQFFPQKNELELLREESRDKGIEISRLKRRLASKKRR